MSAQKQLVKEQVPDFILENPQTSLVKSIEFMKKLTIVSVSLITYLRSIFPEEAYFKKKLDGIDVFTLRGIDSIPNTWTLIDWVNSAFELVASHHLQKMIIVIGKETTTLEMYTFSFTYNHDEIYYDVLGEIEGKEMLSQHSQGVPEDIAKSVRLLIRSILVHSSTLKPLPTGCELSLQIVFDNNVPKELVPEHFCTMTSDDGVNFPSEIENLKLGIVGTKYASFTVSSKSVLSGDSYNISMVDQVRNPTGQYMETEAPGSQVDKDRHTIVPNPSQPILNAQTVDKAIENDSKSSNLSERLSVVSLQEEIVSCICESKDMSDETVKCASCSTLQHKACYKLLSAHLLKSYICIKCHDPKQGRLCPVPELLDDPYRKEMAIYRKAVLYCFNSSQVSCKRLMTHLKVPRRAAEKILCQLQTEGCLDAASKKGYFYNIKEDVMEKLLQRYFKDISDVERPQKMEKGHVLSEPLAKRRRIFTTSTTMRNFLY